LRFTLADPAERNEQSQNRRRLHNHVKDYIMGPRLVVLFRWWFMGDVYRVASSC
jgi:hypothetical protein